MIPAELIIRRCGHVRQFHAVDPSPAGGHAQISRQHGRVSRRSPDWPVCEKEKRGMPIQHALPVMTAPQEGCMHRLSSPVILIRFIVRLNSDNIFYYIDPVVLNYM